MQESKQKRKLLKFIPLAISFSSLTANYREDDFDGYSYEDYATGGKGDDGIFIDKLESKIEYEELVLSMLNSFKGNERIIFLYQLLRELGYEINHEDFAKTLGMNRVYYHNVLRRVRMKTLLMIKGYNTKYKDSL